MSEGYLIGAGYNVPLVSLTDIESIVVSSQVFAGPKVLPLYDDGEEKMRFNRQLFDGGYPSIDWEFGILYYPQRDYLSSTYCSGGRSGLVTIYTTLGSSTFVRVNAVMWIPKKIMMSAEYWFTKARITFNITGAAS